MANYAELDENDIVINVIVVSDRNCMDENGMISEEIGLQFLQSHSDHDRWLMSYTNGTRAREAIIGAPYDREHQVFVSRPIEDGMIWSDAEQDWIWEIPADLVADVVEITPEG